MVMTFLDRRVTSAYQEAQKTAQIPQEYQRLAALMECAAAGNEHCFEALYDALVPRLYALINRILHNRTHAEEVTQEVRLIGYAPLRPPQNVISHAALRSIGNRIITLMTH